MTAESTFPIGATASTGGRTIEAAEFSLLHVLLGAQSPAHVNHHTMGATAVGRPILSGGALVALLTSSWVGSEVERRSLEQNGYTGAGMVDVHVRFRNLVVLGDTLYFRHRLDSARGSRSRAGRVVLTVAASVRTDRFDLVAEGSFMVLADPVPP